MTHEKEKPGKQNNDRTNSTANQQCAFSGLSCDRFDLWIVGLIGFAAGFFWRGWHYRDLVLAFLTMYAIFLPIWVRKQTGKPEFLTISDWEFEAPRIQNQALSSPIEFRII